MALSVQKFLQEDEETETGTPIRYVPLTHLYSATSPCINTSGASMSKKVKARKLEPFDAEVEIPTQKPSPVLRVYQRRARKPRIEPETGETQRDNTEKVEVFVRVADVDQNVNLDKVTENGKRKRAERNCETSRLGVNSNNSREMSGRTRDKRDSLRTGMLNFLKDREKPKGELGSTSVSTKKWVELSFEDVDPNVFVGLPCKVYWPLDDRWYTGSVTGYNLESNKHQIGYDDEEIETLILSKEKVKFHVSREIMERLNVKCSVTKGDKNSQDYDELVALAAAFDDCQEFEPGDIIWAKLTGHSMWPAIVVGESNVSACKGLKPTAGERSIPVQFFGTHDFARISMKHIISFLKGLLSSFHMKCKQARFCRGLEEAKIYLSEQKLPKKMLWLQIGIQADDGESGTDEEEEVVDSGENLSGDEGVQDCIYPLKIGDLRVISLGRIVRDSEHFHNKKYIWPEGFKAERKYTSTTDPCKSTFYKMEVLRNPQSKGWPLFRVTLDNDLQIAGSTPSACWKKIYKKIDSCKALCNGSHTKEGELSGTHKSGSYMFGFSNKKISKLIQDLPGSRLWSKSTRSGLSSKSNLDQPAGYRPVRVDWKDLDKCNVCHMDEEYADNLFLQCDKCRMMVHARCYGEEPKDGVLWLCNLCRDGAPRCPPPCCLCPVTGGAMKPTTDGRWAHLTCAMWIPETCLLDVKKMEPIDGLERINKDRWKLLCSICGVSYGSCIQCSKSTCRVAYHPLCARAAGLCVELEDEDKLHLTSMDEDEDQQCIRLLSFCKKHRQPSNERPSGVEGKMLAARNCSSYMPPSNPSGCARTEPYNFLGRRGRKEPEALAAASVKRLFIEDRPYLVSGYLQNKSLRILPSSNELVLTSFSSSKQKMRSSHPDTVENILSMADKYKHMKETFRKRLAFGKSGIHGFGIFAKQAHKAGDMVIEYIGELVRPPVADLREHFIYNSLVGAGTYMFRIDEERVVDATKAGSIAHLINHSCEPNCYSRMISVHGDEHIIIFAKRDINQWEELTYDYRFFAIEEKLACYCGFTRCRGVVNDTEAEEQVAPIRVPRSELVECTGE
ncbi:histone-lysine N-methyltransferase ATX2-like [Aristolochia californica]|uniref:histone-lysine N-methyltransferase ATX2-like n=1 Tax=Aristolochia californica TaxID=171875 RepID=UPI0035E0281E